MASPQSSAPGGPVPTGPPMDYPSSNGPIPSVGSSNLLGVSGVSSGEKSFAVHLHDQFDLVFKRVTNGRRDMKSMKVYFDERAKTERTYWESLNKCSVAAPELAASSSIAPVWKDIKDTSVALAKEHEQIAFLCTEVSNSLGKFIIEIKKTKTNLLAQHTRLIDDIKAKTVKHGKARDSYAESVKFAEQTIGARENGKHSNLPPNKISQLEAQAARSIQNMNAKHEEYKKSVEILAAAQKTYDHQIIDIMIAFEKIERDRLLHLTKRFDEYKQQHEKLKSGLDLIISSITRSWNSINAQKDIQDFINEKTTNSPVRPHIQYVPIYNDLVDRHVPGRNPPPGGDYPSQEGIVTPVQPPPSGVVDGQFPPSGKVPAPPPPAVGTARGLYDFESKEPDDLPFKAGDIILLVSADESEDWWTGELRGRKGIFPRNYVEKQKDTFIQPPPQNNYAAPLPNYNAAVPPYSGGYAAAPPPPANMYGAVINQNVAIPNPSHYSAPAPAPAPVPAPAQFNQNYHPSMNVPPAGSVGAMSFSHASDPMLEQSPDPSLISNGPSSAAEAPKEMNAKCEALFDFTGVDADELSFKKGDQLFITGELNGWYSGKVAGGDKEGIFPSNYVQLIPS